MAKVTLYSNDGLNGDTIGFTEDVRDLRYHFYEDRGIHDWNDATSSLTVGEGTQATFYRDVAFQGPHETLGPGTYYLADMIAHGIPNDWISSIDITPIG